MKNQIIISIILLIFTFVLYYYYFIRTNVNMTYVKSELNNKFYLVRNVFNKQHASNLLGLISHNIELLVTYLNSIKNEDRCKEYIEYIDLLTSKYKHITYIESEENSMHTSYSVNKGEQIIFCLRTKDNNNNMLHDINLIMYVVLHEISHVACPIYDNHGPLFKKIYTFITKSAVEINLYKKIDFEKSPVIYCGLEINNSII